MAAQFLILGARHLCRFIIVEMRALNRAEACAAKANQTPAIAITCFISNRSRFLISVFPRSNNPQLLSSKFGSMFANFFVAPEFKRN
jgi:hypothetical protein